MDIIRAMLLLLLYVLSVASDEVADLSESSSRVVGGKVVEPPHKYPFQVSQTHNYLPDYNPIKHY